MSQPPEPSEFEAGKSTKYDSSIPNRQTGGSLKYKSRKTKISRPIKRSTTDAYKPVPPIPQEEASAKFDDSYWDSFLKDDDIAVTTDTSNPVEDPTVHERKPSLPLPSRKPSKPSNSAAEAWKQAPKEVLGEKVFIIAVKVL